MRNLNLDFIRVMAMCGVLLDHYMWIFNSTVMSNIGLQMGGGSVEIFFAISSLLYGIKWSKNVYMHFDPWDFIKKRLARIFIPVWITILITIPLEYLIVDRFEPMTILFNVIGLGWAKPFGISGHLWFVTMLVIIYFAFVLLSYFRLDKMRLWGWSVVFVCLTLCHALLADRLTTYSKAGPMLFLYFAALMFCKGEVITCWCKKHKYIPVLCAFISLSISIYIYIQGWHYTNKAWAVYSFIVAGFLTFWALYAYLDIKRKNRTISWLAGISYEVYLIHMPIMPLAGCMTDNIYFKLVLCLLMTFVAAVGINKISAKCNTTC